MSYRPTLLGFVLISASLAMISILSGCGEEEVDPLDVLKRAWDSYEAENYEAAEESFEEVITLDPSIVDAHIGLGWTHGKMASLQECIANFQSALSQEPQNVDALAGIALAYLAEDEYDQAIAKASQLLAISPDYSFEHGSVTSRNLHLVLAESYYYTGDFSKAHSEVDILNPGNELDSSSEDYAASLLEELERTSGG